MSFPTPHEQLDLPVFDFPAAGETVVSLPEADSVTWRVAVVSYESDEQWEKAFARFADAVDLTKVRSLVVGSWSEPFESGPDEVIEALVGASGQLTALRSLFIGDIESEECEISWITQGEVSPLLDSFPGLREFRLRGGQSLGFPAVRHEGLRSLTVETGGLGADVVRGVGESHLPALEHLDLWLGVSEYGGNAELADLAPFLSGASFPKLRYLALRNSEMQDEIAAAMAGAPVVANLEVLDLSMGTLGDVGAEALLGGQPLTHLKKLDLHWNFLTEPMRERLVSVIGAAGVEVDVSETEEAEDDGDGNEWRYTEVSE
jgi:hypothetical protein